MTTEGNPVLRASPGDRLVVQVQHQGGPERDGRSARCTAKTAAPRTSCAGRTERPRCCIRARMSRFSTSRTAGPSCLTFPMVSELGRRVDVHCGGGEGGEPAGAGNGWLRGVVVRSPAPFRRARGASPSPARSRRGTRSCSRTSRRASSTSARACRSSQLLHDQTHTAGTAVVVVTHNREIARVANRVVELSSGHVVSDAPTPGGPARVRGADAGDEDRRLAVLDALVVPRPPPALGARARDLPA